MKPERFDAATGRGEATRIEATLANPYLAELPRPYATLGPKFRFQAECSIDVFLERGFD